MSSVPVVRSNEGYKHSSTSKSDLNDNMKLKLIDGVV